jgi:hypothetical protein
MEIASHFEHGAQVPSDAEVEAQVRGELARLLDHLAVPPGRPSHCMTASKRQFALPASEDRCCDLGRTRPIGHEDEAALRWRPGMQYRLLCDHEGWHPRCQDVVRPTCGARHKPDRGTLRKKLHWTLLSLPSTEFAFDVERIREVTRIGAMLLVLCACLRLLDVKEYY